MCCARCEELEEEIAYLKSELGQVSDVSVLAIMRTLYGIRPQASRIIEKLYRARPRVLNKIRISEALVGDGDSERLVDVFVSHARKALGRDAILTHWGAGYSIGPLGIAAMEASLAAQPTPRAA